MTVLRYRVAWSLMLVSLFLVLSGAGSASAGTAESSPSPTSHRDAPSWETKLGSGVTVIGTGTQPTPGTTSPGAVVEASIAAANTGHLAQSCAFYQPAVQSKCASIAANSPPVATHENLSLGYIAVKGTQALVGLVGTDCENGARPRCISNQNAAKFLSSGHSFGSLYQAAAKSEASPVHMYSLITCVKVGSQWYVYLPPSSL